MLTLSLVNHQRPGSFAGDIVDSMNKQQRQSSCCIIQSVKQRGNPQKNRYKCDQADYTAQKNQHDSGLAKQYGQVRLKLNGAQVITNHHSGIFANLCPAMHSSLYVLELDTCTQNKIKWFTFRHP